MWLFDTGSPISFGDADSVVLNGNTFDLSQNSIGLDAQFISENTGVSCSGLLGVDIINKFDYRLDLIKGTAEVSEEEMPDFGMEIPLSSSMGVPVLSAEISGNVYKMFFDTGAQISYFQDDALSDWPESGIIQDFFPMIGKFETVTHTVTVSIGAESFNIRCGRLSGDLSATLTMTDVNGIIGNEVLRERVVGYFPRRSLLCL